MVLNCYNIALRILQRNNRVRRMTRTGDRGTPEKLNLCKACTYLHNTWILLVNKSHKFLPGEKARKSTSCKLLSVTLCHILSTDVWSKFLRLLFLYLDHTQSGPPPQLSWNRHNYFLSQAQHSSLCYYTPRVFLLSSHRAWQLYRIETCTRSDIPWQLRCSGQRWNRRTVNCVLATWHHM